MVNEHKNHDCSGNNCYCQDSRNWDPKAAQGTEDKALDSCKIDNWKCDSCIDSELMDQEIKASDDSRELEEGLVHLSLNPKKDKIPLENPTLKQIGILNLHLSRL